MDTTHSDMPRDMPRNMLRHFDAEQVHAALAWEPLAAALAQAFVSPPAAPVRHAHGMSSTDHFLLMPAWNSEWIGTKLVTVIPEAVAAGGHTVEATYLLLDRRTGAPRALLNGDALTVRRTAATSALAARMLARTDAHTLLMVGTGHLAPWMVRAHCALHRSLSRVLIWGRNPSAVVALVATLRDEGLPAEAAPDLPDAVGHADIISCATTAVEPIVRGEWVREGTHLDLVGAFTPTMREVDDVAILRACVVVDDVSAALAEAGDLLQPLTHGVIDRDHIRADLATVLRGTAVRRNDRDITLFKSVGHALEDLAAASLVMATAGTASI